MFQRIYGLLDKFGPVISHDQFDPLWERRLKFLNFRLHPIDHVKRILARSHHYRTGDRIPLAVQIRKSAADFGTE